MRVTKGIVWAGAAVVAAFGGFGVASVAASAATPPTIHAEAPAQPLPDTSTPDTSTWEALDVGENESGLTYGSLTTVKDGAKAPDLVSAWATNHKMGYIYYQELRAAEDAAEKASDPLNVYARDGKTVIGQFVFATQG